MKCSLKDGLINIFLIIFIVPSKGIETPLLLQTSSVLDKPMNFKQFKAAINRLQDLDSFPDASDSKNKLHRIVKKQMATTDGKTLKKNKRSVLSIFSLPESFDQIIGDGTHIKSKDERKMTKEASGIDSQQPSQYFRSNQRSDKEFGNPGKLENFAKDKQMFLSNQINKKNSNKENEKIRNLHGNAFALNPRPTDEEENPDVDILKPREDKQQWLKWQFPDKAVKKKYCCESNSDNPIKKEKPYAKSAAMRARAKYARMKAKENQTPTKMKPEDEDMNTFLQNYYTRIPDENDSRCYYECEAKPFGCMRLKHRKCPEGQFFSEKYLRCLKVKPRSIRTVKRSTTCPPPPPPPPPKKTEIFDNSEDSEPANEWLDANQGPLQKIPPEFKPKKIPGLKIYHLCSKRSMNEKLNKKTEKRQHVRKLDSKQLETQKNMADVTKGMNTNLKIRHHRPRSFLIRIRKKEGKENQDQSINENDDDEEESEEESEEEDDEEESEDEDEQTEEEIQESAEEENDDEKPSHKDGLKELFKTVKAAVTNRARFEDPTRPEPGVHQKEVSSLQSKKSEDCGDSDAKSKKVLVDANIRVDSTIGNALKCILKSKMKDNKDSHIGLVANDEALICDRGSQDQMDPELLRMYEHLIRNNPRVKRYFLANCAKKRN